MKQSLINIVHCFYKAYWFIFRPTTYGVKALVIKDNKVLLIKNSYDKLLYLPGGGVKKGETSDQAIIRELREETGVKVLKCHLIGQYTNNKEYKKDNIDLFFVDDFEFENQSPMSVEIAMMGFYPKNALPDNVSPATLKRIHLDPTKTEKGEW